MMSTRPIAVLPFVLCSGLADACDTFTISGRVADQGSGVDTWIGVFEDPLTDQAALVVSTWVGAGEFELEVPCAESVTLLAVRQGAVPLARRISGSVPTAVELRFAPGLSLTGSMHSDENLPINGARVSVTRTDEVEVRGSVSNAFTGELLNDFVLRAFRPYHLGENRSFAFQNAAGQFSAVIARNTREIEISAPGFAPWHTRVDLGAGGAEYHVGDVALEPERIVVGRVLDAATGFPVHAWVRRWIDKSASDRLAPVAWTDEDGRFRLPGLPRDDARIETGALGYAQEVVGVPDGTDHLDIELAGETATIEGILVTDEGVPAKGEVLLGKVGGTAASKHVDDEGRFAFEIAAKANDRYRLVGRSVMGSVASRQLTIRHDNESVAGIRLVVQRLGRVSGVLAGLATAEEASLLVMDESGRVVQHSASFPRTARYSLQGVPEGRFILRATTTRGRAIAREFESDGRGETIVDLVFAGASRLSGVVTAGSRPIPGVTIEATPQDKSSTSGNSTTTSSGAYVIDGLDEGEYTVRVTHPGHQEVSRTVFIGSTIENFDVHLSLSPTDG